MEELVILDSSTGEIHIYNIDSNLEIDESYIKDVLGIDTNYCTWMFCENAKTIIHKNILK